MVAGICWYITIKKQANLLISEDLKKPLTKRENKMGIVQTWFSGVETIPEAIAFAGFMIFLGLALNAIFRK